jgi:hypothetical protein
MTWGSDEMLKGRIAEVIVEEMLKEAGYQVYRFGYEWIIQNLPLDLPLKNTTKNVKKIRNMPDFIVIDRDGFAEFIEVKFRNARPKDKQEFKDLAEAWPECKILFVFKTKPHFQIANICDFVDNDFLFRLEEDKYMKIREDIVKKYDEKVNKSYGI